MIATTNSRFVPDFFGSGALAFIAGPSKSGRSYLAQQLAASLDAGEMAEAVLHAVDCGADEREAVRMTLVEFLDRRGLYRGELRELVDSGRVFQVAEDSGDDGRGTRRMGGERTGRNSAITGTPVQGARNGNAG